MYDLNSLYYTGGSGMTAGLIAGVVVALIGTILAAVYLFGPQKRARFSGFMLKVYAHVNFEHYIIPVILKFLYVFTVIVLVINGLITMFSSSFIAGLLTMILGPLAVRVVYELIMMLFSIHDGIRETNRLLRGGAQPRGGAPQQYNRPMHRGDRSEQSQQPPQQPQQPKQYPGGYDPMHRS